MKTTQAKQNQQTVRSNAPELKKSTITELTDHNIIDIIGGSRLPVSIRTSVHTL